MNFVLNSFITFFFIGIVVDCLVMMVVANTRCYAKNPDGSKVTVEQLNLNEAAIRRNKALGKWSVVFTVATFILVGIFLMTGDIIYHCNEKEVLIEASYYPDMTISYDKILTMEYRESYLKGSRVGGFVSLRLQMGGFESKEFGSYTRYTYNDCKSYIVLTLEGKKNPVIIAGIDAEKTKELYEELQKRVILE